MIRVTINGEMKRFEPGKTVYDIIDEFDRNYTNDTCAVRINGQRLSLEDEITQDCEMELLTFRDMVANRSSEDYDYDEADEEDESDFGFFPDFFDPNAMITFSQMFGEGYFGDNATRMSDKTTDTDAADDPHEDVYVDSQADPYEDNGDQAEELTEQEAEELTEQKAEELTEEVEPESDGEFISVSRNDNRELTPEMLAKEENKDSDVSGNAGIIVAESDDMQMHLNVPKIDDLVAELLVDIEQKDDTELSTDAEGDYSVDDDDMDAFLTSRILPEEVTDDIPDDNEIIAIDHSDSEPIVPVVTNEAWYEVDENAIEDFVDYEKSTPPSPFSEAPESQHNGRKKRIPAFLKVAALLVLLFGIGWLVSRIAIHVAGSPGTVSNGDSKAPVSVADVSKTDEIIPASSEEVTTTTTEATTTTTKVSTTTTGTTTTSAITTTTKATTKAATTKATTTKKATTKPTTKPTKKNTKKTDASTTSSDSTSQTDASTTGSEKPTTNTTEKPTTATTEKPTTATTEKPTTAATQKPTTNPPSPTLGSDEPYDPNEVVG